MLDLCFLNLSHVDLVKYHPLVTVDLHYPPLIISLNIPYDNILTNDNIWFYNFGLADYDSINDFLLDVNWIELLDCSDIDTTVDNFYSCLATIRDQFVFFKCKFSSTYLKWFSKDIIS